VFWSTVFVAVVILAMTARVTAWTDVAGGVAIATAALVPLYAWIKGAAKGIPIYPLWALTFIWTYALPLFRPNRILLAYDSDLRLHVALSVAAALFVGTICWFLVVRRLRKASDVCRMFQPQRGERVFVFAIAFSVSFTLWSLSGHGQMLASGVFSLFRAVALALNAMGIFVLSYRFGRRQLSRPIKVVFLSLLIADVIVGASTLLLIGPMTDVALALTAFSIGRGRVPWRGVLSLGVAVILLHSGKGAMRSDYWAGGQSISMTPTGYVSFFGEWFGRGLSSLFGEADEDRQSLLDRAGLIHLYLLVDSQSPWPTPYLSGETYVVVPRLLIPRIFDPEKPGTHEGTRLLNGRYGLQTQEQSESTTIGWGLLNEANANFGLLGTLALMALLGSWYGWVARWSGGMPALSFRTLFAFVVFSIAIQTELTLGVYLPALLQSVGTLAAVNFFLMESRRISQVQD
jgi:hypothetical protein